MAGSGYFGYFPRIDYDMNCGQANTTPVLTSVVDLTKRFRVLPSLLSRTVLFYTYDVMDGERPDTVAYKFYQNSKLDWLILMTNQILDPFWDWPMSYLDFTAMLASKYGSLSSAQRGIHHYEQIVQAAGENPDGSLIPEQTVIVDATAYAALPAVQAYAITNYDYENKLNESRRTIKIIRDEFLRQVLNEAESILKV